MKAERRVEVDTAGLIDTRGGSPDFTHGGLDSHEGILFRHGSQIRLQLSAASPTIRPQPKVDHRNKKY